MHLLGITRTAVAPHMPLFNTALCASHFLSCALALTSQTYTKVYSYHDTPVLPDAVWPCLKTWYNLKYRMATTRARPSFLAWP